MQRKKILFTSTLSSTFILEDLKLLQKHYEVTHLYTVGLAAPFRILSVLPSHDVTFTWFASTYACVVVFLARLFGKQSIIVVGGADAAHVPELRYGIWRNPLKALLVKYAVRHAYRVLAVDPSLQQNIAHLARYGGDNIRYVPTGYDYERWRPSGPKEPIVLTVAGCNDRWKMRVKGLDVLFETARACTDVRFVVVGMGERLVREMRASVPTNVELISFVEQSALLTFYQRAAVYCQPSYADGFPNSLCEAMLCECVPVGSNAGGIPTAIADNGYLVPYGDDRGLAFAIRSALAAPPDRGIRAREFVARRFTLERRETALQRIIDEAVP